MSPSAEYRSGPLRYCEWQGFWKATPEVSAMTDEEWDQACASLRQWLCGRYLAEWDTHWQRHCCVEGDFAEPERTIKIVIEVADVLTVDFLQFVQQWLREKGALWRVSIPTDNTDSNLILVYPDTIRINEQAESDVKEFLKTIRPSLAKLIEEGRRRFGIRPKPIPPFP
jgi:hypothetical protein